MRTNPGWKGSVVPSGSAWVFPITCSMLNSSTESRSRVTPFPLPFCLSQNSHAKTLSNPNLTDSPLCTNVIRYVTRAPPIGGPKACLFLFDQVMNAEEPPRPAESLGGMRNSHAEPIHELGKQWPHAAVVVWGTGQPPPLRNAVAWEEGRHRTLSGTRLGGSRRSG